MKVMAIMRNTEAKGAEAAEVEEGDAAEETIIISSSTDKVIVKASSRFKKEKVGEGVGEAVEATKEEEAIMVETTKVAMELNIDPEIEVGVETTEVEAETEEETRITTTSSEKMIFTTIRELLGLVLGNSTYLQMSVSHMSKHQEFRQMFQEDLSHNKNERI